jgi:hypothetical protein
MAGSTPSFIVNGTPDAGQYPSVGAMLYDVNQDGVITGVDQWCSGSLIAPDRFLTAGHCVYFLPRNTQLYISFSTDLLLAPSLSFIPATGYVYDPQICFHCNNHHDLAVIFLPAGSTTGLTPLALPPAGLLDQLAAQGGLRNQLFVNVGYGTSATRTGQPSYPYDAKRNVSLSPFMGLKPYWLGLLMNNNATGLGGDCYHDSGGPKFLDGNPTMIVATTTTGDIPCRATSWDYRLDTQSARDFLGQFLTLP